MHKIYRTLYIAAVALLACSCNEQEMLQPQESDIVQVPITLNIGVSDGIKIASRSENYRSEYNTAPRRPVTWTGEQCVNDLRIYIFGSDTPDGDYIYVGGGDCKEDGSYRLNDFCNTIPWSGKVMEQHVYTFFPKLKKGRYYKFLAVGRDDSGASAVPNLNSVEFIVWGTKSYGMANFTNQTMDEAVLTNALGERHYPYVNTEVFTGMLTYNDPNTGKPVEDYVYVEDSKSGFEKELMLRRAVAGVNVYVTDIPTTAIDNTGREAYDGSMFEPDELTMYMTVASRTLKLKPSLDGTIQRPERTKASVQIGYVDFNNKYGEKEGKAWYSAGSEYWRRDAIQNYKGVTIPSNTAMMANFVFPIPYDIIDEGSATFSIQLRQKESDYISVRRVKCKIESLTDPETGQTQPYEGNSVRFSISPNCFYAIGSPDAPFSLSIMSPSAESRAAEEEIEMYIVK